MKAGKLFRTSFVAPDGGKKLQVSGGYPSPGTAGPSRYLPFCVRVPLYVRECVGVCVWACASPRARARVCACACVCVHVRGCMPRRAYVGACVCVRVWVRA